jgi:hypothetical protein
MVPIHHTKLPNSIRTFPGFYFNIFRDSDSAREKSTIIKNCYDQDHEWWEVKFPNEGKEHKSKLSGLRREKVIVKPSGNILGSMGGAAMLDEHIEKVCMGISQTVLIVLNSVETSSKLNQHAMIEKF